MADLLERMLFFTAESVSQPKDQLFARRQTTDQRAHTHSHAVIVDPAIRHFRSPIRDEVFETLFRASHVRFEGDGLTRKSIQRFERVGIGPERRSQLCRGRFATQLARQFGPNTLAPLEPVMNMRGQSDRARVVLDRTNERLTNPPDRVGRKLEAAAMVELFHGANQAQVAFLDQIRERQTEISVILGDRDDELEVVLDEAILHRRHRVVCILDGVGQLEHSLLFDTRVEFELRELLRSLACLPHVGAE